MAKKFALVSPLYSFAVQDIMDKIIEKAEGEDIEIIQSTPGGSVFAAWSLAGFLKDREGSVTMKAFGDCSSMGFFNALYVDKVVALDVTQFTIHRADGYVETDDDRKMLNNINTELRKAMEAKLDQEKFEKITGKTFDDIFNPNDRINVTITAKEAKKIGLVDEIVKMTDKQVTALNEKFAAFSDFFDESKPQGRDDDTQGRENQKPDPKAKTNNSSTNQKPIKKMNKVKLQAEHPELYAEIYGEGVTAERKRCSAFLAYKDIDLDASVKAIKEGTEMDACYMAEMNATALKKNNLKASKTESPDPVDPPKGDEGKTPEELKAEAQLKSAEAAVLRNLGIE